MDERKCELLSRRIGLPDRLCAW